MTAVLAGRDATARTLMERVLRHGEPLAPEYPLVFQERFPGRIVALGEGDEVHSACATLVRDFVVPGGTIRGGLIGSVSTREDLQGRGLGTRLLLAAEEALQQEGCVFALLWGEDPRFYLARGYCPISAEEDFAIPTTLADSLPGGAARPFVGGDLAAIHGLYERHPARVVRAPEETAALLACPGMQTLVLEREGRIVAYACRGRGSDLADAIHEWGGDSEDVLALARAHLAHRFPGREQGCLYLMAPTGADDLRHALVERGADHRRGILGLGKLISRPAAAAVVRERIAPHGTVRITATAAGERFLICGPGGEGLLDDDGMLALLMPASEVRGDVDRFLRQFGLEDARLPLEPFVWGLDSI